jgi:hypothetical protein
MDQAARAPWRGTQAAKRRYLTVVALAQRPVDSFLPICASTAGQQARHYHVGRRVSRDERRHQPSQDKHRHLPQGDKT